MVVYFTDTDGDFDKELAAHYGFEMISMPYSIGDKVVYPYVDFDKFDSHAFYDMLREGALPNTSAISREKYIEYFEPHFKAGNDIFYVHFSRAMTATFDAMDEALAILKEKYPERKFYEIDTLGITTISYVITREVGDMVLAGRTPEEILAWADKEVSKYALYFFADDLKFFRHSGRVSGLAATMGTVLGIRPIIYMSDEGKMVSCGKARGRANAIDYLLGRVDELGDDIENHYIVVAHTDAEDLAEEVKGMLLERYPEKKLNILVVVANPTTGAHCGPNGVGICFHAIHK